jgi:hypothetical protein
MSPAKGHNLQPSPAQPQVSPARTQGKRLRLKITRRRASTAGAACAAPAATSAMEPAAGATGTAAPRASGDHGITQCQASDSSAGDGQDAAAVHDKNSTSPPSESQQSGARAARSDAHVESEHVHNDASSGQPIATAVEQEAIGAASKAKANQHDSSTCSARKSAWRGAGALEHDAASASHPSQPQPKPRRSRLQPKCVRMADRSDARADSVAASTVMPAQEPAHQADFMAVESAGRNSEPVNCLKRRLSTPASCRLVSDLLAKDQHADKAAPANNIDVPAPTIPPVRPSPLCNAADAGSPPRQRQRQKPLSNRQPQHRTPRLHPSVPRPPPAQREPRPGAWPGAPWHGSSMQRSQPPRAPPPPGPPPPDPWHRSEWQQTMQAPSEHGFAPACLLPTGASAASSMPTQMYVAHPGMPQVVILQQVATATLAPVACVPYGTSGASTVPAQSCSTLHLVAAPAQSTGVLRPAA